MTVTKTGKRKLFRMTTKRKIMLGDIISALNIKLDTVNKNGFRRLLVLENEHLTEEQRKLKLQVLDTQLQKLSLIHDVLEVVNVHEDDIFLKHLMKEDRGWRNEWDVPLEVFNESIDEMIEILRWFQGSTVVHIPKEQYKEYDKQVEFLLEIKAFRNQK